MSHLFAHDEDSLLLIHLKNLFIYPSLYEVKLHNFFAILNLISSLPLTLSNLKQVLYNK